MVGVLIMNTEAVAIYSDLVDEETKQYCALLSEVHVQTFNGVHKFTVCFCADLHEMSERNKNLRRNK